MIYLPPLRRFLIPALASVTLIILYRALLATHSLPSFILHSPPAPPQGIHIPISALQKPLPLFNASDNHLSPPNDYFYSYEDTQSPNKSRSLLWQPALDPNLAPLFQCSRKVNEYTGHIRLPNIIHNISVIPPSPQLKPETRIFWNPTIIALPYWSQNQYLLVSRIVTDGNHQENVLCEANVCYVGSDETARPGEKSCTQDDLKYVGPTGGMRCVAPPITLSVPPTPAEKCEGKFGPYADIPGFHDPRLFWSGKGEPLMMVNTQSRYACFGLWIIDLRTLHPSLQTLLASSPTIPSLGPLKSYPTLTELTRNPPSTRSTIEKNWFLFFPSSGESYIHYELPSAQKPTRGRTFAKLLGNGLTTTNLTDPLEQACLQALTKDEDPQFATRDAATETQMSSGTWHQATNSLRLILCKRSDKKCKTSPENTVFFALIHRKHINGLKLPLRYERFFMVWSATPPFGMLGISKHPLLLANETASGFTPSQNWADDFDNAQLVAKRDSAVAGLRGNSSEPLVDKANWAYFTYTVSMSYAWGRVPRVKGAGGDEVHDMHVGYLDDEVVLGIGVDDVGQGFSRVKAGELVECLRACPGRVERRIPPQDK